MTNSFDRLLRQTLDDPAAPSSSCLDAETAAAFADNALTRHDRSRAEAHVADCARCQAVLAALARISPPVLARPWWRRPAIAWIAPLTAAAAALLVWVSVPRETPTQLAVQSTREDASSTRSEPLLTPSAPPAEPRRESPSSAADARRPAQRPVDLRQRRGAIASNAVPAAPPPSALAERRASESPVLAETPGADVQATEADRATVGARPADTASAKVAPATGAAAAAAADTVASRQTEAQLPSRRLQAAAPEATAPSVASRAGPTLPAPRERREAPAERITVLAGTVTETTQTTGRSTAYGLDAGPETVIVSSNPISRWRIGSHGVVQHSADGGTTWHTQATGVTVTLTAGSSPSPSVCWLVGPGGVVLISIDAGRSWQRLAFPVAVDLVSIRAADDKIAAVVTSDGRTFRTSDRGRTWTR